MCATLLAAFDGEEAEAWDDSGTLLEIPSQPSP
jgi:hypothetical protein